MYSYDRRTANDVGQIILEQMGGARRVQVMLGAKLQLIPDGVIIQWPNRERSKGNRVEIKLQPSDTYEMIFYNVSGSSKKPVKRYDDVYAEDLIRLFESQTGWRLRF